MWHGNRATQMIPNTRVSRIPVRAHYQSTSTRSRLLDPRTWALSCDVFERAVALEAGHRAAFLKTACGSDPDVLQLVRRMLEADDARPNAVDRMDAALGPVRALGHRARRPGFTTTEE